MPVDPATGERLPYAGEPGAPADAPPMPPGGPAPMPQNGAAPMNGAAPASREEAMRAIEEEQAARMQAVASSAPQPKEELEVKLIEKLVSELNTLASKALGDAEVPEITFDPGGMKKITTPLPPNVFVPLVAVSEMAAQLQFEKYTFDPKELDSNASLRKIAAILRQMHGDKDFMEAVTAPADQMGPEVEEQEDLAPGEFSPEDEELMEAIPEDDLMTA
jgi:phosphate uptake regulator